MGHQFFHISAIHLTGLSHKYVFQELCAVRDPASASPAIVIVKTDITVSQLKCDSRMC